MLQGGNDVLGHELLEVEAAEGSVLDQEDHVHQRRLGDRAENDHGGGRCEVSGLEDGWGHCNSFYFLGPAKDSLLSVLLGVAQAVHLYSVTVQSRR